MMEQSISKKYTLTSELIKWSAIHSILILASTTIGMISGRIWPVLISALVTFSYLIYTANGRWTEQQSFGIGNYLTLLRLIAILIVGYYSLELNNLVIAALGFIILISDGIDGQIARRKNQHSEFGEYFDKETDAYFLHILCLISIFKQILWPWVIVLGLLRYILAVVLFFYNKETGKERRSRIGRYIYVFVIVALLISFIPVPALYKPLIVVAAITLFYSFSRDIKWLIFQR